MRYALRVCVCVCSYGARNIYTLCLSWFLYFHPWPFHSNSNQIVCFFISPLFSFLFFLVSCCCCCWWTGAEYCTYVKNKIDASSHPIHIYTMMLLGLLYQPHWIYRIICCLWPQKLCIVCMNIMPTVPYNNTQPLYKQRCAYGPMDVWNIMDTYYDRKNPLNLPRKLWYASWSTHTGGHC